MQPTLACVDSHLSHTHLSSATHCVGILCNDCDNSFALCMCVFFCVLVIVNMLLSCC